MSPGSPPAPAQLQTEQNADRQFDAAQVQRVDLAVQVDKIIDRLDAIHERQTKTDAKLETIATANVEMLEVFNAGKKGVHFLQGLGSFLNRLARWATPILMLAGALWALFHGQPPKGHE